MVFYTFLCRYTCWCRTLVARRVVAESCFPGRFVVRFFVLYLSRLLCPANNSHIKEVSAELSRQGVWLRIYLSLSVCLPAGLCSGSISTLPSLWHTVKTTLISFLLRKCFLGLPFFLLTFVSFEYDLAQLPKVFLKAQLLASELCGNCVQGLCAQI